MSNLVKQINDAIETRIAAVLTGETELEYKLDIAKNNFRNSAERYACIPLDAETTEGINLHYTLNHTFQVILTKGYVNRHDDSPQRTATFDLYTDMDTVIKDLVLSKAGLPGIIIVIQGLTLSEPEYLTEDNVAVLRANFIVKYRGQVT